MHASNLRKTVRQISEQMIDVNDYQSDLSLQAVTKKFSIDQNSQVEGVHFETGHLVPRGRENYIYVSPFSTFLQDSITYSGVARFAWCREKISETTRPLFEVGAYCITSECSLCKNNVSGLGVDCGDVCLCLKCMKHMKSMPVSIMKRNPERFMMGNYIRQ